MSKRKIILSGVAFYLFSAVAANAEPGIQVNFGEPVYIAQPAYFYPYPTYYDHQHRRHDFEYWQQRRVHEQHGNVRNQERDREYMHQHRY